MENSESTLKIEKLSDSNYHSWKQKTTPVSTLKNLDQYLTEGAPKKEDDSDGKRTEKWPRDDQKAQAIIGLAMSDEHLEHVKYAKSAEDMRETIKNVYERHTLLNRITARHRFYIVSMKDGEKVLFYLNRMKKFFATLKLMDVKTDNKKMAIAVLNRLPPSYETLINAMGAVGPDDSSFS